MKTAWESVTESTISNCFRKAGFSLPLELKVDEEDPFVDLEEETACQDDDPMQQLQLANRCSFDECVAADDGVQCSPMPTIQDIVSSVTQISEEGETDDIGDPLPPVTYKQAYSAFQDLRSYLLCSQGKDSCTLLSNVESELFKVGSNSLVQSQITDYMSNYILLLVMCTCVATCVVCKLYKKARALYSV